MDWVSLTGYVAASLVASTFYVKNMVPLRCFAIASNIFFIVYAYYSMPRLYPVLVLHLYLLPLNGLRLRELIKQQRPRPVASGRILRQA